MPTSESPSLGIRILAMFLDHMIMTFMIVLLFIPGMISSFSSIMEVNHEPQDLNMFGSMTYLMAFGFAMYFCKDSFNGRSPAKRALNLQVINIIDGKAASPFRCLIRNAILILWPLEVIVALANGGRRLGDLVAGTQVIGLSSRPAPSKINYPQVAGAFAIASGAMLLFILPYQGLMSRVSEKQATYQEGTLDESLSLETEKLLKDALGNIAVPDVQVYESVKGLEELAYVSVILRMKEYSYEADDAYKQLTDSTSQLIYTKFPENTFIGRVQFVFEEPGSMTIRELRLD